MAVDAFIWFKVPASASADLAPKGETTDDFFKDFNAFELKSFNFEINNKATMGSATGGAGGGKIQFGEFKINKPTDRATPIFFRNCAAGMHYEVVSIAIRKAGGEAGKTKASSGKAYLVYHFGTVFTTGISWSGPEEEGPKEDITFAFGELKMMYYPQSADGTMAPQAKIAEWSQLKNLNKFSATPLAFQV